jgi:hypothetical protein
MGKILDIKKEGNAAKLLIIIFFYCSTFSLYFVVRFRDYLIITKVENLKLYI